MAANITDHYIDPNSSGRPVPTTLTAEKQVADGSITCASLSGWATDTAVHFVIYETDTDGNKIAGTQSDWKGIVSGSTINTLTLTGGTDQVYPVGATVVASPTAGWGSDLVTGLLVEHDQDGTHGAVTATSLTTSGAVLTSPKVITGVNDTNGNELLKVTATASAVNELTLANAATGNNPVLSATGGDTNIGITLTPKGTGVVTISDTSGLGGAWTSWTPTWTNLTVGNGTLTGRYVKIGKTIIANVELVFGTTTSVTGTTISVSLPVTSASRYGTSSRVLYGYATLLDNGTATYPAQLEGGPSTSIVEIRAINTAGTYGTAGALTSTIPFTWTTGDSFNLTMTYEAA